MGLSWAAGLVMGGALLVSGALARKLFPYVLPVCVLIVGNLIPVIHHLFRDALSGLSAAIALVLALMVMVAWKSRPLLIFFLALFAAEFLGLLVPAYAKTEEWTGRSRLALADRFVCLTLIRRPQALAYRVTALESGVTVLVLAGRDRAGSPALCSTTAEHVPLFNSLGLKPHEKIDLADERRFHVFLDHPEASKGHWEGWGTVGPIPSVRQGSFRFPLRVDDGNVTLLTGRSSEYWVMIERL